LDQAFTDPVLRLGDADQSLDLGDGWTAGSWTGSDADHQLGRHGRPVGWVHRLPRGPWGGAVWIAVQLRGSGAQPQAVADGDGLPLFCPDHVTALRTLQQAAPADRAPQPAVRLALKRPTGWQPPTLRGLGSPVRTELRGDLVHLRWPGHAGIEALERGGQLAGWIELYDLAKGTWVALIGSSLVSSAANREPILTTTSGEALALLGRALDQDLAP
jgi:hypothetical protein